MSASNNCSSSARLRLRRFQQRRLVVVDQVLRGQQVFVVLAETLRAFHRGLARHAERDQHFAAHFQARSEGLAEHFDAQVHQLPGMAAIVRAREHLEVRIQPSHHAHGAQARLDVVDGD